MRRLALAAVLLVSVAEAAPSASDPSAPRAPTEVRGTLTGATASFTARYMIATGGRRYAQGEVHLEIPPAALVTAATVTQAGVVHRLELMPREVAETRFNALTTETASPSPPSAVLLTGRAGDVELSIASPRAGTLSIELEVAMPTCFSRDQRYVFVPASWAVRAVGARVVPRAALAETCPGAVEDDGKWLGFPSPAAAKRSSGDRVAAFAGRIALGDEHVARVELDLAGALADVPRDLATVLVIDASRSMSEAELSAQRELVLSYLRNARESRVQVIAYARTATALLPGWMSARQALPRLERALRHLAPRNGSNFDVGLAEAARWLERTTGTRRVVLITDERMAERLAQPSAVTFKRVLPEGTLVHVVAADGKMTGLVRDDEALLAGLAAATDGMPVRLGAVADDHPLDATMLVRPISLDQVTVDGPGWTRIARHEMSCGDDTLVAEGEACVWWGQGDRRSGPIVVAGLVWGKRFARLLAPSLAQGRDVARELVTLGIMDATHATQVAAQAHAVTENWAMYAQWGGRGGYADGFGFGRSGSCCGNWNSNDVGIGIGTIGTMGRTTTPTELRAQLAPLVAKCALGKDRVHVELELTFLEIVDVRVTTTARERTSPVQVQRLEECVTEALWDAAPMLGHVLAHQVVPVEL